MANLKLFIVHSHYRPGGVRRVIELAAPHVAAAPERGSRVVVAMLLRSGPYSVMVRSPTIA